MKEFKDFCNWSQNKTLNLQCTFVKNLTTDDVIYGENEPEIHRVVKKKRDVYCP